MSEQEIMQEDQIRKSVRKAYGQRAQDQSSCCGPAEADSTRDAAQVISKKIGYGEEDLASVPEGANMGLGCGNPVALASLAKGETVLDLGSGGGFDCFLAANKVGPEGKVIGVDMTAQMIDKARENAAKGDYPNVEFRLGEIENIPAADNSVDVIISNCVINLSPKKKRVFEEALRVLKPGGRLMVSDIVLLQELPDSLKNSVEAYAGCIAGAVMKDEYIDSIKKAGFGEIKLVDKGGFSIDYVLADPTVQGVLGEAGLTLEDLRQLGDVAASVQVEATKPH